MCTPVAPRDSSFRIPLTSAFEIWYAGKAPAAMLTKKDVPITNASAGKSNANSIQDGRNCSVAVSNARMVPNAMRVPTTADAQARRTASEKNGNTTRRRPPPMAVRTATSFMRSVARASSRFATFAHATSSRRITDTIMAMKTTPKSNGVCHADHDMKRMPTPSLVSGCSRASPFAMDASSSRA